MKTLSDIKELENKKVLIRCDFDVPVSDDGKIQEPFRIKKQKAAITHLLDSKATVVMVAHISATDSFRDLLSQLEELLGHKINFIETPGQLSKTGELNLLDNLRRWPGEKDNDSEFAKKLADGFDYYVNNAFAVAHRKHASVAMITEFLPSYAGFILEEETKKLSNVLTTPPDGKIFIMGGAKASTKIPVIKNFLDKAEKILLGGVIVNDVLKAKGEDVGDSKCDEDPENLFEGLDLDSPQLVMPVDYNRFENKILDLGPKTAELYGEIINSAKMVIWNGPVGYFEDERFAKVTNAVAEAIVSSKAVRIIGGGDTIAAVNKVNLLDKFNFVSTGGGAMLAFLSGEKLPALEALHYYEM